MKEEFPVFKISYVGGAYRTMRAVSNDAVLNRLKWEHDVSGRRFDETKIEKIERVAA